MNDVAKIKSKKDVDKLRMVCYYEEVALTNECSLKTEQNEASTKKSGSERLAPGGKCSSDETYLYVDGGKLFSARCCELKLDIRS
jgi:hypothetical protein